MSIHHVILGLLHQCPQSGYDLKKAISTSPFMHWSGNNNQVYTSLIHLSREGFVSASIIEGSGYPGKKIYTITPAGLEELKKWLSTTPALFEMHNQFIIQFLFAESLSTQQRYNLMDSYEEELKQALITLQELFRRELNAPNEALSKMAFRRLSFSNLINHYQTELNWIAQARQELDSIA